MSTKTVTKDGNPQELFIGLDPGVQSYVKGLLLQCFADEVTPTIRNKIGDATAEIARQIFDAGLFFICVEIRTVLRSVLSHFQMESGRNY